MASLARRATASSPSRHGHRQPSTAAFGVDFLETAEIGLFGLTFIYFIYFRGFSRIAMQRPLCRIMTLQWEHWSFWMTIRCLAHSGLEVLIPLISVFLCVQAETDRNSQQRKVFGGNRRPIVEFAVEDKRKHSTQSTQSLFEVCWKFGCWPLSFLGWGCRRKRNSILVWHAQTSWLFHCIAQISCFGYVLISLC
jgi:hypothetical protein